jgi:hypothetical protein
VQNRSAEPATIHRDRFRLLAPDGSTVPTVTAGAAEPVAVSGNGTQTFQLRFMAHGGLACARPMSLDADRAVTVGERPVAFQPVSFTPRQAL